MGILEYNFKRLSYIFDILNYSISNSGYEIYRIIIFQFVLRRHITLWQFVGAALIVISIAIAKTPDILQIFSRSSTTVDDETVRASLMDRNDTKHDSNVNEDINQTAVVNAIPLTAILLALVASCNSGTTRSKYFNVSDWLFQKYAFSNFSCMFLNPNYFFQLEF